MNYIKTNPLKNSTIMKIYAEKDEIKLDPEYQRMGGVWNEEKRQLLIDSILNDYDIPKIYFHAYQEKKDAYDFAVIDGRQRLETIWGFMEDEFSLASDFKYYKNPDLKLQGLKYSEIATKHPKIRIDFDSVTLPIIAVETDDIDLIEDMFSRLNEAVPLNAAEKRNAIGGEMVKSIRNIVKDSFFTEKVKVSNSRYQHYGIAVKFLYFEERISKKKYFIDTSKSFLDSFVKEYKDNKYASDVQIFEKEVRIVLEVLDNIFDSKDNLLKRQSDIPIYYLLVRDAMNQGLIEKITRIKLEEFQSLIASVGKKSPDELSDKDYNHYNYNIASQHGTNNSANIKNRVELIENIFGIDYEKSLINGNLITSPQ
jgi:hypothetical protein